MIRSRLAVCAAGVLALFAASVSRAAVPSLYFHYASDCSFQLVDDSGSAVTTIPPGAYQVVVDSQYPLADNPGTCIYPQFDLTGPGVSVTSDLDGGGSVIAQFEVVLQPGSTYVAQDDSAPARTRRTFTTTATGTAAPVATKGTSPSTGSGSSHSSSGGPKSAIGGALIPNAPRRGTLVATVTGSGKLTLTKNGKPVTTLPSGRYDLTVFDQSRSTGFTLQAIKSPPIPVTGGTFVGKRTKSLTLNRGQWLFYGSFVGKKTYFLVTAASV